MYVSDGEGAGSNRRVVVADASGKFLRQWQPADMDTVHCMTIGNDGLVYVCNRNGSRIQVYDKMGVLKRTIEVPWTPVTPPTDGKQAAFGGSTVAIDFSPDQNLIFVVNQNNAEIEMIDRASGKIVGSFGRSGNFPGQFNQPHGIAVDSRGNVYVAENRGRADPQVHDRQSIAAHRGRSEGVSECQRRAVVVDHSRAVQPSSWPRSFSVRVTCSRRLRGQNTIVAPVLPLKQVAYIKASNAEAYDHLADGGGNQGHSAETRWRSAPTAIRWRSARHTRAVAPRASTATRTTIRPMRPAPSTSSSARATPGRSRRMSRRPTPGSAIISARPS